MKKLIYLFAIAMLVFGCKEYNDQFTGYDEVPIIQQKTLEYTLTDDDYDEIGGAPADYGNFSSSVPAADYLPDFLADKYPSLDVNSAVLVTYKYYRGGLDYLDYLTNAVSYELTTADYDSMGEESGQPGKYNNFDSSTPPEDYLPAFFTSKYPDAQSGDLVFVTYKFYSGGTSDISEYYEFDGSTWAAVEVDLPEGVTSYTLSSDDYDSMGENSDQPGKYNNFSSSISPDAYLPTFLSLKFPYAMEEDKVALVYKYYSSGSTLNRATQYTKTTDGWEAYQSTITKTDQYLRTNSGWIFDPTVLYTMETDDYQMIVDYVGANIDQGYVSSYGNNETYYGSNAYYNEFQIGDAYFDNTFATWQDAVKEAIGTAFLPAKYPNAVSKVEGVDVNYIISFSAYLSGMVDYSITFQCTKSGPNPEFTYVEGPTAK